MPLHEHLLVPFATRSGLALCSAIIGMIRADPIVLLIERDDNHFTSITNALDAVTKSVAAFAMQSFNDPNRGVFVGTPLVEDRTDIRWFEAYEYRIRPASNYRDPAVMQIDLSNETWHPINAPTFEALRPFFAVFQTPPKVCTCLY